MTTILIKIMPSNNRNHFLFGFLNLSSPLLVIVETIILHKPCPTRKLPHDDVPKERNWSVHQTRDWVLITFVIYFLCNDNQIFRKKLMDKIFSLLSSVNFRIFLEHVESTSVHSIFIPHRYQIHCFQLYVFDATFRHSLKKFCRSWNKKDLQMKIVSRNGKSWHWRISSARDHPQWKAWPCKGGCQKSQNEVSSVWVNWHSVFS